MVTDVPSVQLSMDKAKPEEEEEEDDYNIPIKEVILLLPNIYVHVYCLHMHAN